MRSLLPATIGTVPIQRSITFLQLQRYRPPMAPISSAKWRLIPRGQGDSISGGTPDPSAIDDRGVFDPIDHLSRELREETGINIDELDAEPGWILARDRCSVAFIRRLISRQNADDLRRRVINHIRAEQQPELSDVYIVRGPAQLDARMPTFVTTFLQEQWRQATAKIY